MISEPSNIPTRDAAQELRREMAELRCQLRQDFDGTAKQAKQLTDWKHYVKQAPWAAFGVSALAAFAVVPRPLQVKTMGAEAAAKLASQDRLTVQSKPKKPQNGGLSGFIIKTAITMAVRAAVGAVTEKAAATTTAAKQS